MNPLLGWALAVALFVTSWITYGWKGLALAFSVVVFWLLLQFNRTVRVMKNASHRPVGRVDSAVMLHARLHAGMRMFEILALTKSLGEKLGDAPERWRWSDEGGAAVTVELAGGRVSRWTIERPAEPAQS